MADRVAYAHAIAERLVQENSHQYPVGNGQYEDDSSNKRKYSDAGGYDGPSAKRTLNSDDPYGHSSVVDANGNVTDTYYCPREKVGKLIGKDGMTIKELQASTNTRVQIDHKAANPEMKPVSITGQLADVRIARQRIVDIIESETQSGPGPYSGPSASDLTQTIDCPQTIVGRIIGRGGETIKSLQMASSAHIIVNQDFPDGVPRKVVISGRSDAVQRAVNMVNEMIHGEPASTQSIISKYGIGITRTIECPKGLIGKIIGKGGETIKNIQRSNGASLQIEQDIDPCKITITGPQSAVENASRAVHQLMNETNNMGNMGGGFGGPYPGPAPYGAPFGGYPMPGHMGPGGPAPYNPYGYGAAPYGGGYPTMPQPAGGGYGYPGYGGGAPAADPYAGYGGASAGGYQASSAAPAAAPASAASTVWQELHDNEGRPYYYNSQTGVSQWEKPAEMR